jgi:hypothetical protein
MAKEVLVKPLQQRNICSTLAPGFYLRSTMDFNLWKNQMINMQRKYKMDFIFSLFFERPKSVCDWDDESPKKYDDENLGTPSPAKVKRVECKPIKTIRIDN